MRNSERERGFTSAWGSYEEQRASRELAGLDKFDNHPTRLKGHVGESRLRSPGKRHVLREHCSAL